MTVIIKNGVVSFEDSPEIDPGGCKDCGLELEGTPCEADDSDHPGICCDCYDEKWGMPSKSRIRPRPQDEETPHETRKG